MPISVQPVDGLISRLLQQYHRTAGESPASRGAAKARHDHVDVSDRARQGGESGKLESSLLGLYNQRGDV